VPVPSKRLPFFKVGKELKELVNTSRHSPLVPDEDDEPESADDESMPDSHVQHERSSSE
jgi:integration host factor subunit beta